MSQRFLMGLDLGGGGGRCLLVDVESAAVTTAFRHWDYGPAADVPMSSELDPDRCWALLGEAIREALAAAGAAAAEVAGVAASAMRLAGAVVDGRGEPVFVASNRDARGFHHVLGGLVQDGALYHRRTGQWPNPISPAARLLWLLDRRGPAALRSLSALSLSDWLALRLCGEIASDPTQASGSLLFELETRGWAWHLIERLGLPRELFPPVREPGTALGALLPEAAAALGLAPGTPVGVGGGDTQLALLGAGALAAGDLGAVIGSSAPVQRVVDAPLRDDDGRLWTQHHVLPGRWVVESNGGGMGDSLVWIAGLLYPDSAHPVLALLAEAERSQPGARGMYSTLGADVMDARQLGLPLGQLTFSPVAAPDDPERRRHLARSIVEGMAYGVRANVEQTDAAAGSPARSVRLAGGISRSAFFTQLVADALGRPALVAAATNASALGAAICAGVAAGVFPDLAEGAERLARITRRHPPDAGRAARYAALYEGWTELRAARREADAVAARLALAEVGAGEAGEAAAADDGYRPRILVTAEMDDEALAALRELGDVEHQGFKKAMRLLTGRGLVEALAGVQVLVSEIDVIDAPALAEANDLRVLVVCRGDAVNADVEACTELGIPVLNTPGRNADAVADLALAFLLMLARKLPEASGFLRQPGGEAGDMGRMGRAFGTLQGRELWRKTVGLIGLGAVGRKVVERLRPFGAHCLVCDPFLDPDAVRLAGAEPVALPELLARSDFVSLHAAVTDASRGLIDAPALAQMKPGAFLVNTARAALVDEAALIDALASGHLGGAALDVFSVEPPGSDHPLLAFENVIATPHVGGNTAEVAVHQGQIVAEELGRLRRGERPRHLLNPEVLARFRWSEPRPAPEPELVARLRERTGAAVTDLQKEKKQRGSTAPVRDQAPTAPSRDQAPEAPAPAPEPAAAGGAGEAVRERMERIVAEFVRRIVADPRLREQAASQDVTLHFVLSDLGTEFYFGLAAGEVRGALGAPDAAAPVQLKLSADLLDGMFTGRRNPMQAAMEGELSFSGDTAKAMTLTHLQRDLERLYREARTAVGDPGDLTALPRRGAAAAPAAPAAGEQREQLIEVVKELYAAHLITATGGNASVRCPDDPEQAWITPSQLFKGDLRPEHMVRVGMDGRAVDPDARSPSSEALMHVAVLAARADARAVIHCHAPHATILANTGLPFLPVSTEAAFFTHIGRIPFVMPGTRELADAVVGALGEGWAVLMQNHGLLVAGRTLRRAADMAEIIERTSEVILGCYAVGVEPPVLPPETVELLARYGDLMA